MALTISINVDDDRWAEHLPNLEAFTNDILHATLEPFLKNAASPHQTVEVLFTNAAQMQQINREHRGKDAPTNVLSFQYYASLEELMNISLPIVLGDIVLCLEVIGSEAIGQNKPFSHHVAHMLVHGGLHILGFDHENDEDADLMEKKETEILKTFNLPSPYDTIDGD